MKDENPAIRPVWQICALCGLLAFAIEKWLAHLDQKDADALRTEIVRLQSKTARRQITEAGKELLKNAISKHPKHPKQELRIHVRKFDEEAVALAKQFSDVLAEYGWLANIWLAWNPQEICPPGVGVFAGPSADNRAGKIITDIRAVLETDGIGTFIEWTLPEPTPDECIDIFIGKRPSEAELLRRELAQTRAPRTLTQPQKDIFKSRLSKYAPQKFQIIQIGYGNNEAYSFANQIREALSDCGWGGGAVYAGFPAADQPAEIGSGVTIGTSFTELLVAMKSGTEWKEPEALTELRSVFRDTGIEQAKGMTMRQYGKLPLPPETVEIVVGPKPTA